MITLTLMLAIALIGTDHLVGAFRDYDDPRTASPPLIVPASRPHDVLIVDNANISNYYQLFTSPFNMGKLIDPVNDIECIVLELEEETWIPRKFGDCCFVCSFCCCLVFMMGCMKGFTGLSGNSG